MPQRTKISKLPDALLEQINRLCGDRALTLDQIVEKLKNIDLPEPVSRAAIGRHRLKIEDVAKYMRASREAVQTLKGELGDLSDDEQSRLNYEMLQGQLFQAQMHMMAGDYNPEQMIKEMRQLADAFFRLAASRKLDADRVTKIRKETAQKAATEVGKMAKAEGWSAETVARVRDNILKVA